MYKSAYLYRTDLGNLLERASADGMGCVSGLTKVRFLQEADDGSTFPRATDKVADRPCVAAVAQPDARPPRGTRPPVRSARAIALKVACSVAAESDDSGW
jgi:hypothetical protein